MEETKKQALKKTIMDFFNLSKPLMALAVAGWVVRYIIINAERIFNSVVMVVGIHTLIGVVLFLIFSGLFYARYKFNLNKIETGEPQDIKQWLGASEIPTTIPPGRYNIILTNKAIIWNTTEQVFEANRSEVTEWLRKS